MKINDLYIEENSIPEPNSGCWLWEGYCNPDGYGQRKINGKSIRMHRLSFELYNGGIPANLHVLHRCDNPMCCNPEHLFLGTHSDNMKDMWSKGRHVRPKPGVGGKLTVEQVEEIRKREGTISGLALSKEYPVNSQTIRNIWLGVTWRQHEE